MEQNIFYNTNTCSHIEFGSSFRNQRSESFCRAILEGYSKYRFFKRKVMNLKICSTSIFIYLQQLSSEDLFSSVAKRQTEPAKEWERTLTQFDLWKSNKNYNYHNIMKYLLRYQLDSPLPSSVFTFS